MKKIISFRNRIPKDYFVTKGCGSSDITVHAGSYHLALKNAGIQMMNIMTYSSILPPIANKLSTPNEIKHGEVAEVIMSCCTKQKGEICTAGIIYGWLYDKNTKEKFGGLVCEREGSLTEIEMEDELRKSLNELYINGYSENYILKDEEIFIESFIPDKKWGTAIVALVFQNYVTEIEE